MSGHEVDNGAAGGKWGGGARHGGTEHGKVCEDGKGSGEAMWLTFSAMLLACCVYAMRGADGRSNQMSPTSTTVGGFRIPT